mmetsp:Transcript_15177/g.23093  ORF Transcript_15177/g.23093 Transcript_15177/m.23093 type:complete len:406 (+) Transcript_15177:47-1264(+)|eukprot:CAMPEP_0118681224 /NCGR_PEP_ID=MMETSP0800-20121206/4817_1 /TAXON_ID=210618 ORGANISM="Striatella unipunctata, Strain CCMP2910" /NCGR_SAMPLE_ID=MMETSP0800 /ASSEMBLY_ACC=CAM_ASM_000638 /LENGTH=405 /DNA_ID=CAMNT_0006577491 /DNA_START=27 /DNA_END=1244 /DNA_ORIENTATION=+
MSSEASSNNPATALSLADFYYVDENYELALDTYTGFLAMEEGVDATSRFRALSHRSATLAKLSRHSESLEDAQIASTMISSENSMNLLPHEGEVCQYRIGQAALGLGNRVLALEAFKHASQLASLNGRSTTNYDQLIKESSPKKKEPTNSPDNAAAAVKDEVVKDAKVSQPQPLSKSRPTAPKYQYYQNDTYMTIAILETKVQEKDLKVDIGEQKISVQLHKQGQDFTILAGTLYDPIIVEKSKTLIKDEKVLIKLRKGQTYEWNELFGKAKEKEEDLAKLKTAGEDDEDEEMTEIPIIQDAKMPTPYASKRDWNKIDRHLKEKEANEIPKGEEAMDKLFKNIYANASEDTRRAMIKSFQTSNGTVLSTNWDEVSKTDYEKQRRAPKGMEWKDADGKTLPSEDSD